MGQVRHRSATTTHAIRAAIQRSQASTAELSRTYGINPKTVSKWRKRATVEGPEDRAAGAALKRSERRRGGGDRRVPAAHAAAAGRLPLRSATVDTPPDPLFPASRSAAAWDQSVADVGDKPTKRKFRPYPIGYFHLDIAELRTREAKLYLLVAIDRASKFAFDRLVAKAGKLAAAEFLRDLIEAVPYRIHTVLTDNGVHFSKRDRERHAIAHIFGRVCREHDIEHRLTNVNHPWTNGQVERMSRTIEDATVRRYHYESHDQLRSHLADFLAAYNFARRLKTLGGLTPYEFICKAWTSEPERFRLDPIHQMPGLNA